MTRSLCRPGNLSFHGTMRQECLDLTRPHLLWMACVVEQDGAAYPIDGGAFGPNRVVSHPHDAPSPIEQFLLGPWSARVLDILLIVRHDTSKSSPRDRCMGMSR